jgi:hypothetical protein
MLNMDRPGFHFLDEGQDFLAGSGLVHETRGSGRETAFKQQTVSPFRAAAQK